MRYLFLLFFAFAASAMQAQSTSDFKKSYNIDFSSAVAAAKTQYMPVVNVVITNRKINLFYNRADSSDLLVGDSSIVLNGLSKEVITDYVSNALTRRFFTAGQESDTGYNSAAIAVARKVADDYIEDLINNEAKANFNLRVGDLARALDGIDSLYEIGLFVRLNLPDKKNLLPLNNNGYGAKKLIAGDYNDSISVERVTLGFSNWNLGNVVVYGKVKRKKGGYGTYDSLITLNNIRVIPVSSRNILSKIQNEPLFNTSRQYNLTLSQVLSIYPNDSLVFDLYVPQRTYLEFDKKIITSKDKNNRVKPVYKPTIASYFNYAVFGDLTGYIQDDAPNGKFQTEASAMLPLLVRPVRIHKVPRRSYKRMSLFIGKSFAPEICVAKFGTDNRFLPVQYNNSVIVYDPEQQDTLIPIDTISVKHVNNMDVLQFANFWAGGRFNILTLEGKNPSWALYLNFRFRYLKTELADTSHGFNNLPQVRTVSYEPEFTFKRKISRNFYAEMGVSVNMLRLYSNAYELSFEKQFGDGRDSAFTVTPRIGFGDFITGRAFFQSGFRKQLIWTPQLTLRYNPPASPMSGAFVRISYPFNEPQNNSFLIAQIGISKPISNLLNKAKTAPPPAN